MCLEQIIFRHVDNADQSAISHAFMSLASATAYHLGAKGMSLLPNVKLTAPAVDLIRGLARCYSRYGPNGSSAPRRTERR